MTIEIVCVKFGTTKLNTKQTMNNKTHDVLRTKISIDHLTYETPL